MEGSLILVVVVSALRLVYSLAAWSMTIVLVHRLGPGSTITQRCRGGSLVVTIKGTRR